MRTLVLLCCLGGLTVPAAAQPSGDATQVDVELVLAVDMSYSMDVDELRLQRDGYVAAITSPQVLDAITKGIHGRIAVAYVEWAGAAQQQVTIDWHVIDGAASARAFADKLLESPPRRAYRTSISAALGFVAPMFETNRYEGARRVIDISGDGPNNQGGLVTDARDAVLAEGIVINGLPLMLKEANSWALDLDDLEGYYRECVVGGPGSFVVALRDKSRFAETIRTKLVLEIAGLQPPARLVPVRDGPISCTVGELIWLERYGALEPQVR